MSGQVEEVVQHVQRVLQLAEALVPKDDDVNVKEIGDLVESEMQSTTSAIEAAADKIQVRSCARFRQGLCKIYFRTEQGSDEF